MNTSKRGLGRGLGALIPSGPHASRRIAGPGTAPSDAPVVDAQHPHVRREMQYSTALLGESKPGVADEVGGTGTGDPGTPTAGSASNADADRPAASEQQYAGAYFAEVPLDAIRPNPRQPRTVFDQDAMSELVASISAVGLLQPVVVRQTGSDEFELVMGERRWRAALGAGLEAIPAIVRETADDDLLRDALLENLHRAQLNPLEEAAAYQQLLDDFGSTHDELAARIGRSRPHISNTLRLLKLAPAVQRKVAAGVLTAGHARALVAVQDTGVQERLALRVVAEGLSVRTLEELVATGEEDQPPPRQPRTRVSAPGLTDIADRLSERFETRCRVELGRRKGKISIEFASLDDLDRILASLGTSPE